MATLEPETQVALRKARALLVILLATCENTLLALQAAANALDTTLTADLKAMIERSQEELQVIDTKLATPSGLSGGRGKR